MLGRNGRSAVQIPKGVTVIPTVTPITNSITPNVNPSSKTQALNSLQTENAQGKMSSSQQAPTIVSAPQSTTVNNQASTVLAMTPSAKNTFWDNAT